MTWRYDVLEQDPAAGWFIAADPTLKKVLLHTRQAPSTALLDDLTVRVRHRGYQGELEFPPAR